MPKVRLQAMQSQVESVGYRWKFLSVALKGEQTIAEVLETPDAWSDIQADRARHLNKGDQVSIISSDGLVVCDKAMVTKAEKGHLWFSKP